MTGRFYAALAVGLGVTLLARPPLAAAAEAPESASAPEVGTPEATAAARAHFTRGRDLYQAGSYREAIVELDAARALDPKAKDLVFNLAIVHEKLGQIDDALRYARLYAQMDLEPAERTRAESYIKRLEGAKAEVAVAKPTHGSTSGSPPPGDVDRTRGRLDAATIVVGVVAIGAVAAGTALGVKALGDKPPANVETGPSLTYQTLVNQQTTAHTEAVAADACFGGAAAAAVVATVLYFARYRDAAPTATSGASHVRVAPWLGASAGGLVLGGTF